MAKSKQRFIILQLVAILVLTGTFLVSRSYLAKAVGVSPNNVENGMTGSGIPADPYMVADCQNLQDISLNMESYYVLANNIECSDTINWNGGTGFVPIGDQSNAFLGTLDGHGYQIQHIYIDQSSNNSGDGLAGVFGKIHQGKLLDFKVADAVIYGNNTLSGAITGGVVGNTHQGVIDHVSFSGVIHADGCSVGGSTGGIAGYISSDGYSGINTMTYNSTSGSIEITGSGCTFTGSTGGLVGQSGNADLHANTSIININITGQASASCLTSDCAVVGGIVGRKNFDGAISISESYSSGAVSLIGDSGTHLSYVVGGMIGRIDTDANVAHSFSTMDFTGIPTTCNNVSCDSSSRQIGGLFGFTDGFGGDWNDYWYDQTQSNDAHCTDGTSVNDASCNVVNTDGSEPDYFKNTQSVAPLTSWDFGTYWYTSPDRLPGLPNRNGSPHAPTNVAASITSESALHITWTASEPAQEIDHYEIYCKTTDATTWSLCADAVDANSQSADLTNLTTATSYVIRVVVYGTNAYISDPSADLTATTATPGFNLVSNCQELQDMQNALSANFELAHNIDCSDTITWNGGAGFTPIGSFDLMNAPVPFTGLLKGNNYTVSNLYIDGTISNNPNVGLFGCVDHAVIQDLKLVDPIVNNFYIASSLIAFDFGSTITNVHVHNSVINGEGVAAGGLVGYSSRNQAATTTISKSEYNGTIDLNSNAFYIGGLVSADTGQVVIENSFANAQITALRASAAGGLVGFTTGSELVASEITNSYAAGSITMTNTDVYVDPDPNALPVSAIGSLVGAALAGNQQMVGITNSFGSVAVDTVTPDKVVGGVIGLAYFIDGDTNMSDLSSTYFDADLAGLTDCVGNDTASCNPISGQPSYFKNNSSNPPLDHWNFTSIWKTTSEFPIFGSAVTAGITTVPPDRLPQPTDNNSGSVGTTTPVAGPTNTVEQAAAGADVSANGASLPSDETGVLGAIKHFVRNLPAAVVVAFPYALFGLLLLAAVILLVELMRELRRIHALQLLIGKQRSLAEERDAFWHLAANYLRAPVTLIVGGSEALYDAATNPITTEIQHLAASLQANVAEIMKKIEDSTSLQSISAVQPRKVTAIARRASFIIPVASIAALSILANYAAASYRNMSPGLIGYTTQLLGFIVATIIFYWVLSLLTQGKSRRRAAQAQLDRQTNELANARHQLISDTTRQLNPDLTVLEGTIAQLPPAQAALEPTKTLREGTNRLREIITSFVLLIKVQENTGAVPAAASKSRVDLANILTRTRAKLTPQITAKGVRVLAPAVPLAVHAQADLANQVLESIIANAVDYSPNNGTVKVEAQRLQDAIQLRVTDQGKGIDSQQLEHLFKPFVRADGTSAMDMSHGGFGINLYLDKLIMEQLGGTISASSVPGKGTSITMTWPV